MFGFKKRRRRKVREEPFPQAWLGILENDVVYFRRLSPEDRAELRGHIQVFLAEKTFEGCGGLEMTDEIRVAIAALACVLLLHRETDYYPALCTILVYPQQYSSYESEQLDDGVVVEGEDERLGESWYRGPVVLSWDDIQLAAAGEDDGHNVVFHEFAHQLDGETGEEDGAPLLSKGNQYADWQRVMKSEYERLIDYADNDRESVLDQYGAADPAEFFAVATEAFFEDPVRLKKRHPELYEQLMLFYQQDPATRF